MYQPIMVSHGPSWPAPIPVFGTDLACPLPVNTWSAYCIIIHHSWDIFIIPVTMVLHGHREQVSLLPHCYLLVYVARAQGNIRRRVRMVVVSGILPTMEHRGQWRQAQVLLYGSVYVAPCRVNIRAHVY